MSERADYLIIGGGFFGCCLALFLRSISDKVIVLEAEDQLLNRASRVNQARVHTGFHYPRSVLTAVRSLAVHQRFIEDFGDAISGDFQMLYAIARRRSKVSAKRFWRMFKDMGAPIAPASPVQAALFDSAAVEDVFACTELAFDYSVLRQIMTARLLAADVDVRLSHTVEALVEGDQTATARLTDGREISASHVFNLTYAHLNQLLQPDNRPKADLRFELAELALIEPPEEFAGIGVTVMDGPFFSCMPYPATQQHSLSHVRYTPHASWAGQTAAPNGVLELALGGMVQSRFRHMQLDAQRYVPSLAKAKQQGSLFEVKSVLVRNESDDGRPILFARNPHDSRITSVMGGKIDNIYDLFEILRRSDPQFAQADERFLLPMAAAA